MLAPLCDPDDMFIGICKLPAEFVLIDMLPDTLGWSEPLRAYRPLCLFHATALEGYPFEHANWHIEPLFPAEMEDR